MLLIQTNKQIKKELPVCCAGPDTRHSGPSIQPWKNVLPRNNFKTYNTFWKGGEAANKQQGIWFVWLVQITKCEVIFISVRFTQQSILSPCPTHLPPALPFLSLCTPLPSLPSLPTESWHFFSAPIPSLLNSSPLFPSKVFVSFCYRSGPYFPPHSLPSFPSILHLSLNSFPFSRSQLQSFPFS